MDVLSARRAPPIRKSAVIPLLLALLVAAVVGLLFMTTRGPHFVSRLSVVNPTAYQFDVDATNGNHKAWTSVGVVGPRTTEGFQDVVDQGDRWTLRFTYAGQPAGELSVSRQDLARDQWRVEVPVAFGEKLRAAGVNPPPG